MRRQKPFSLSRSVAQSDERIVERAAGEVKRQQDSLAVLFDDICVQKGQETRGILGRVSKTQAIADVPPVRRFNSRAPRVFANFRHKNHFGCNRSFVPKPNASEAKEGCHLPQSMPMICLVVGVDALTPSLS